MCQDNSGPDIPHQIGYHLDVVFSIRDKHFPSTIEMVYTVNFSLAVGVLECYKKHMHEKVNITRFKLIAQNHSKGHYKLI